MAPKKDKLSAPLSSTTGVVARIVHSFAALTLDVNAGNGQDVELSLQDGRKILEYSEILMERTLSRVATVRRGFQSRSCPCPCPCPCPHHVLSVFSLPVSRVPLLHASPHVSPSRVSPPVAVGKMAGMVDESNAEAHGPALAHAERIDRLAAPWLPLQGPKASDAERTVVQGELLEALNGLNSSLAGGGYIGGGSLTYGDVVVLPAVLWLWQYVFGEDVKGGLENVGGWVGRMLEDERVLAGVGGTCAVSVF